MTSSGMPAASRSADRGRPTVSAESWRNHSTHRIVANGHIWTYHVDVCGMGSEQHVSVSGNAHH